MAVTPSQTKPAVPATQAGQPAAQQAPVAAASSTAAKPATVSPQTQGQTQTPQQAIQQNAQQLQKKPQKTFKTLFKKPDWLFIVACIIAVLHVVLLGWLENEKGEYAELKKADADRIYVLQKASSVTQDDVNILEKAFLDEKSVIAFIQTLESTRPMFDEFTLAFTSDEPQGKDPQYLPFTITGIGARETTLSFVKKLLSSDYVIDAETISLVENDEDSTKLEITFSGDLYIRNTK